MLRLTAVSGKSLRHFLFRRSYEASNNEVGDGQSQDDEKNQLRLKQSSIENGA